MKDLVSCVIPTYKLLSKLIDCVEYLKQNTRNMLQIIVVDNNVNEDDGTREWCSRNNIDYLKNSVNSFPAAINLGIENSTGKYIVWLNNDVWVSPGWDQLLIDSMNLAAQSKLIKKCEMIGPMSNAVGGPQAVNVYGQYDASTFNNFATAFSVSAPQQSVMTGFLSGFCLMHTRELYNQVGPLDESFGIDAHGGFEDNDYVTRAILKGYTPLIANSVFVHHHCSSTFNKYFPEDQGGLKNRIRYYHKWKEYNSARTNLGVCYRVRIPNDRHMEYFLMSIRKSCTFANSITIYNDHSPVENFHSLIKEVSEQNPFVKFLIEDKNHDAFNERDDRNYTIDLCRTLNPDWILALDHDEIMDDDFDRAQAERLMSSCDPRFKNFVFHFATFHDGFTHFRKDGLMGKMAGARMFRNVPDRKIVRGNTIGLHCGSTPEFARNEIGHTSFRIKHFGYIDKDEDRERKKNYYNNLDSDLKRKDVGADNYNHVADESGLRIYEYVDNNAASLVMMVKNEERNLGELLQEHWPLFREIVIVDTGSSDRTIDVAKCFTDSVYDYSRRAIDFDSDGLLLNFSKPRNYGIEKATSRWIFVMDADEKIGNHNNVRYMMDEPSVDAYLLPIKNMQNMKGYTLSESIRVFKNNLCIRFSGRIHEVIEKTNYPNLNFKRANGFDYFNFGFLKDKKDVQKKMDHYTKLIFLSLEEDINNSKMWNCLGEHFANRQQYKIAHHCFILASKLNKDFFYPRKNLSLLYMKMSRQFMMQVYNLIPDVHPYKPHAEKFCEDTEQYTHDLIVGEPSKMGSWDIVRYQKLIASMEQDVDLLDFPFEQMLKKE